VLIGNGESGQMVMATASTMDVWLIYDLWDVGVERYGATLMVNPLLCVSSEGVSVR
jgi:hypothetical protein